MTWGSVIPHAYGKVTLNLMGAMMSNDDHTLNKIDNLYMEIRKLGEKIVELKTICETQVENQADAAIKINRIEREMHQAKGAISLVKYIGAISGTSVIALFIWIVTSANVLNGDMREIKANQQYIEKNVDDSYKEIENLKREVERLKNAQKTPTL